MPFAASFWDGGKWTMLNLVRQALFAPVARQRTNFYSIDILRGIAAVAVVLFHYKNFVYGGGTLSRPIDSLENIAILHWLGFVKEHGGVAVMAFWSISGFVFMCTYAGSRPTGWNFFIKRFARLYPLHFVTLMVMAALQLFAVYKLGHELVYMENSLSNFGLHLFMASGWGLEQGRSFNFPIWSVSVEIVVYALFFLFIKYVVPRLATLIVVFLAFELIALAIGDTRGIFLCGGFFFAGAITYALYSHFNGRYRKPMIALTVIAGLVAIAMGLASRSLPIPTSLWLVPAIQVILMLLACLQTEKNSSWLKRSKPIGDITYSSYLWHMPLQLIFLLGAGLGYWQVDMAFSDAFLLSYMVTVCVVATASFHLIEKPAQRRILSRGDRPSQAPATPATQSAN